MTTTNTTTATEAQTLALGDLISNMANLRREAAPEMTEDQIFASVIASLIEMMVAA